MDTYERNITLSLLERVASGMSYKDASKELDSVLALYQEAKDKVALEDKEADKLLIPSGDNPYFLDGQLERAFAVQEKITELLNALVLDFSKQKMKEICQAIRAFEKEYVGVGDTATDENIADVLKKMYKKKWGKTPSKLGKEFYYWLHWAEDKEFIRNCKRKDCRYINAEDVEKCDDCTENKNCGEDEISHYEDKE